MKFYQKYIFHLMISFKSFLVKKKIFFFTLIYNFNKNGKYVLSKILTEIKHLPKMFFNIKK